ncbi:MAG: DUF421 domain-containing protein [Phenylobacterium sp.]
MDVIRSLIGPDESAQPWQICVRAVIVLVFGLICLRIAGRRTFAQATPLDIFVAIVVGSNLSRIMTGKASFFGGLAATLLLVILHRLLAMATLRWNLLGRFIKSAPVTIVKDGAVDRRAMARHELGDDDLAEWLRMEGLESVEDVRLATIEPGGKVSVVKKRG